jgi:four helix bundle protein
MKNDKGLEQLEIYQLAMEIGEMVWKEASDWKTFPQKTIADQYLRAADSIAANISEGYGRFHFKDSRQFCFIARGSLSETRTWTSKANSRNLISTDFFVKITDKIVICNKKLNNYINWLEKQMQNEKK